MIEISVMKANFALILSVLFLTAHSNANDAAWAIADGGNGHTYRAIVSGDIDWEEANVIAQNMGGYLVTITSKEENDFVFNLIDEPQYWAPIAGRNSGPWIGAFQPEGSAEPDGGWRWVTDEGLLSETFDNWGPQEPNNRGGSAEFIANFASPSSSIRLSTWNDTTNGVPVVAFVVEFDFAILLGDINLDGQVNLLDVSGFTQLLTSGEFQIEADLNCDGNVDLLDVAPFVNLLSGG